MQELPLKSDAFTGGQRLHSAAEEANSGPPLWIMLNNIAAGFNSATVLSTDLDLSAATTEVVESASYGLSIANGTNAAVTLPDFASAPDGWAHSFVSLGNTATIVHAGSDTINGIAGDITVPTHGLVKVMKVTGLSGWLAVGGTAPTPS